MLTFQEFICIATVLVKSLPQPGIEPQAKLCRRTGAKSQIYVRFHRKAGRLASRCIGRIQNLDPICQQRVPVTQTQVEEAFYGCSCEYTAPNNKGERAFQRDKGQKEGNTWTFH